MYYIKVPYLILAKGSPHEGGNMINKVLAIIVYISGLFDSKSIVKEVVWRKQTNKGGGVYSSKEGIIYIYIYIYIYHVQGVEARLPRHDRGHLDGVAHVLPICQYAQSPY